MRIETATEENLAFGLEPCSPPVVEVTVGGELILQVQFADGIRGNVKFLPTHLTGVFEPLKNPSFFAKAYVEHGAVTWPGELDLAPDAMYDEVKQNGIWILQ
jgi:hypothetical protein